MVENKKKPVVLITGVSGYLGSHIALEFLKDGGFTVRGTVRDLNNEKKITPLRQAFSELFDQLTLVEADLEDLHSIFEAIKGSDYVVHTASPFPMKQPKDEQELIRPAVQGTLAVMQACHVYKVQRIVITSSLQAIQFMKPENMPLDLIFNEKNWSDPQGEHLNAYSKSKTMAEKAAWDFQLKKNKDEQTEIVVINPGMILGPAFVGAGFTSGEIIADTINGKYPGVPKFSCPIVDVRDCARAHLNAIKIPEAANKRFILVGQSVWFKQVAEILLEEFKPQGYSFSKWELCKWMASLGSLFNNDLKLLMRFWDLETKFDNSQSKQILRIEYRPVNQTIIEMAYSMFKTGALEDKRNNK